MFDNKQKLNLFIKIISLSYQELSSNISSTESDANKRIGKAWTAIDRLSIILKADLLDEKMNSAKP